MILQSKVTIKYPFQNLQMVLWENSYQMQIKNNEPISQLKLDVEQKPTKKWFVHDELNVIGAPNVMQNKLEKKKKCAISLNERKFKTAAKWSIESQCLFNAYYSILFQLRYSDLYHCCFSFIFRLLFRLLLVNSFKLNALFLCKKKPRRTHTQRRALNGYDTHKWYCTSKIMKQNKAHENNKPQQQ